MLEGFIIDFSTLQAEGKALLEGFILTICITGLSSLLALFVALGMTFLRTTYIEFLDIVLDAYTAVFRNIPILIILFFLYKGLPSFGLVLSPITCGVIGLTCYGSAYLAEVFQSGLSAVPKQQFQSAEALGLTVIQRFFNVIMPQVFKLSIPAAANIVVNICKNSALLAFITVNDLFYVVYKGGVTFFHYLEFFTVGLLGYLILNYSITLAFKLLEIILYNPLSIPNSYWQTQKYQAGTMAKEVVYVTNNPPLV